jgi:Protein of unknown function (DUF2842)
MRVRILLGTFALIGGLAVYSLLVMRLAVDFLPEHWAAQSLFYLAAGIIWILPAARLTRWMQAAPSRGRGSAGNTSPRSGRSRG